MKQSLAQAKAEASVVSEPDPVPNAMPADEYEADVAADDAEIEEVLEPDDPPMQTGIPEALQDEIRELAAVQAEATEVYPEDVQVHEEGLEAEEEAALAEAEAEYDEQEPEEPPKQPRTPRRYEFALQASALKAFLAQIGHLVDEAKVCATRDGWHVLAVDPAHVAMIDLSLTDPIDCFERVRSTNALERIGGEVEFGIDLTKMQEVLRLAKKDDTVHMAVDLPDADDKDRITVEIGRTTRSMPAIDASGMADPKVPALDLPAKVTMAAEDLLEAVKAAESISDHVRLTATHDGLNVFAEGDTDKVSMDFRHGETCEVEMSGDKWTSLFPLDYFGTFLKVVKGERLVVCLGTDYPVRVDWEGTTKGTYLLAPRIEESA